VKILLTAMLDSRKSGVEEWYKFDIQGRSHEIKSERYTLYLPISGNICVRTSILGCGDQDPCKRLEEQRVRHMCMDKIEHADPIEAVF